MEEGKKVKFIVFLGILITMFFVLCGCTDLKEVELETIPDYKYHYTLLSEEGKTCYAHLVTGVRAMEEEIVVPTEDKELAISAFFAVYYDYPEFFWIETEKIGAGNSGSGNSVVHVSYKYAKEEKNALQKTIDTYIESVVSDISADASDYEKIKYTYETIIRDSEYGLNAANNEDIYGVFVDHEAVCTGYAMATSYLLEQLNIPCAYITGTANGNPHAWNLVLCNGEYCWVDTTYGDPLSSNGTNAPVGDISNIDYAYLCFDDSVLNASHVPSDEYQIPDCT